MSIIRRYNLNAEDVLLIEEEGIRKIRGYAAKYETIFEVYPGFRETIARGFFDGMDMSNVVALFNHNDNFLLGRRSNKASSLTLTVDEFGLFFEIRDSGTSAFDNAYKDIAAGNIEGCSFAFTVKDDKHERNGDDEVLRTLLKGDVLYDVGPVVHPAYTDTEVEACKRSAKEALHKQVPATEAPTEEYYTKLKYKLK